MNDGTDDHRPIFLHGLLYVEYLQVYNEKIYFQRIEKIDV